MMLNRYICDVFEEMRKLHKTRNYAFLPGLIEEAQTLANRMEAGLREKEDYETWHKRAKKEKEEYHRLLKLTNKLRKKAERQRSRFISYVFVCGSCRLFMRDFALDVEELEEMRNYQLVLWMQQQPSQQKHLARVDWQREREGF
jgi:hypothetical protein